MTKGWDDPDSDPLEDLENAFNYMREQKPVRYEDLKLTIPTSIVEASIKLNKIERLWEQAATIIISKEAQQMLQKHCLKNNIKFQENIFPFKNL